MLEIREINKKNSINTGIKHVGTCWNMLESEKTGAISLSNTIQHFYTVSGTFQRLTN